MGFLDKLFGSATPWGAVGNAIGGIANGISSIVTNKQNIKAQRKENALNRQFAENMYNKYESPAAQAQQMREAGLNPQGAITPNSVGTASTSPLPTSQAPDFGSAIQSIFAIPEAKLSLENMKLQNDSMRQKNETDRLTNMKLAVEANDWESYWKEYKRGLKNTNDKTLHEAQKAFEDARLARVAANNAERAQASGINEFVDEHNVAVATEKKLTQDVTESAQRVAESINRIQNDNKRIAIETSNSLAYVKHLDTEDKNTDWDSTLKYFEYKSEYMKDEFRTLFGVDIETLPPSLKSSSYLFYLLADSYKNGNLSEEAYNTEFTNWHNLIQEWKLNSRKKDNPDYTTPLQQWQVKMAQRELELKIDQFLVNGFKILSGSIPSSGATPSAPPASTPNYFSTSTTF